MSFNDPVADMLNRIMNASRAGHPSVEVRYSKLCCSILDVMVEEGFITSYSANPEAFTAEVVIKYNDKAPAIKKVTRESRPGLRKYIQSDVPQVNNGLALIILSTNQGVIAGWKARQQNVGGEWLCTIY